MLRKLLQTLSNGFQRCFSYQILACYSIRTKYLKKYTRLVCSDGSNFGSRYRSESIRIFNICQNLKGFTKKSRPDISKMLRKLLQMLSRAFQICFSFQILACYSTRIKYLGVFLSLSGSDGSIFGSHYRQGSSRIIKISAKFSGFPNKPGPDTSQMLR